MHSSSTSTPASVSIGNQNRPKSRHHYECPILYRSENPIGKKVHCRYGFTRTASCFHVYPPGVHSPPIKSQSFLIQSILSLVIQSVNNKLISVRYLNHSPQKTIQTAIHLVTKSNFIIFNVHERDQKAMYSSLFPLTCSRNCLIRSRKS